MSDKLITLTISEETYERVQEAAQASARSPEEVLVESIDLIFQQETELPALEAISTYSEEQLWAVVQRRLSWSQSLRLRELSAKNKLQPLSNAEETELEQLLDLNDSYVLLRSEALRLLQERGQDIHAYLNIGN